MSMKYPTYASTAEHMAPLCYPLGILMLLEHKAVFCRKSKFAFSCSASQRRPAPTPVSPKHRCWEGLKHNCTVSPQLQSSLAVRDFTTDLQKPPCLWWPAQSHMRREGDYRGLWTPNAPLLRQTVQLQRKQHNLSLSYITNNIATFWSIPEMSFTILLTLESFYTCHLPAFFLFSWQFADFCLCFILILVLKCS